MKTQEITLRGKPFLVNAEDACISSWILQGHPFDGTEMSLVRQFVKPGDAVVDIGANIGLYTTLLSECVGPTGKVYAFEPDPDNYAILQANIGARGIMNVQAEQMALYSHAGPLTLYSGGSNKGAHSVVYRASEATPTTEIWALTYDEYFADKPSIAFVKMDVEGSEAEVLAGAPSIFDPARNSPRMMMFEYNEIMQSRASEKMQDAMVRLMDAGFTLSLICENVVGTFGKQEMPGLMASLRGLYVNIWCARCCKG